MNFKRIKTTAAAGILAASMILPNMTAFAATKDTNGAVATAQIEKTVEVATGVSSIPEADKNITFLVHQVDNVDKSKRPTEVADQTVTIDVGSMTSDTTAAFAKDILTSDVINGLTYGEYTFEITETTAASESDFGWTTVDSEKAGTYYLRVVVKADDSKNYFITKTNGDTTVGNKLGEVAYKNIYNKKSVDTNTGAANTLKVTNQVKAEDKDTVNPNNVYPTTIVFTAPTQQTKITQGTSYVAKVVNASGNETKTTVNWSSESGKVTISADLKDGETIVVDSIAVGATYTVTEAEDTIKSKDANFQDGYFFIDGSNTSVQTCENQAFAEANKTVTIENDFATITVTGVVTNIAPYVTLVVVAVAAIAAYVALKRRVAR